MAAEQTDRIAYLMELDEKYASVILRRYAEATGRSRITCQRGNTQYTYLDLSNSRPRPRIKPHTMQGKQGVKMSR
nr:hypothetical protein [Trueperella pyogenes]